MPLAHVAGAPLEELLPALAGAGGLLVLARGWVALRLRRGLPRPSDEERR